MGGGVIIDGKVLTGCFHGGAELGHIVLDYGGRQCSCGRRGCFEAYCSATALINITKEKFLSEKNTLMHEMCGNDVNMSAGNRVCRHEAGRQGGSRGC